MPPAMPTMGGYDGMLAQPGDSAPVVDRIEDRRKKESVESLVQELCEGPPDHMSSVLRAALERGWGPDLQVALQEFEERKRAEISRVCNRHYSEFIDAVEELMKMRTDLVALRDQVVDLNSGVQETGRTALTTARMLLQQRHAGHNIQSAERIVGRCEHIVNMVMDAFVHIHEEKYYSALNTMDEIQRRLSELGGVKFAAQLRMWMPSLTEMINKATKEEMSQWLVDIREVSYKIGGAAMRRYAKIHAASNDATTSSAGISPEYSYVLLTFSVRFLLRLEELLGSSLRLDESELAEFVPDFLKEEEAGLQEEEERCLDHLSDYLHPVHRALHIFSHLNMLDDFKAWYLDYRRPMAELRSMITRDLDHLDTEGFLTYLPTLANGIAGFFIVEHTLLQKVDHREGLLSTLQLEEAWMHCQTSLKGLVEVHMRSLSRPGHFLQVKETILALVHLMDDLKLDTHLLMDMLRKIKEPFQKLLLLAFEGECRRIMQEEQFQSLEIRDRAEYESFVVPLGLHEAGGEQVQDVVDSTYLEVIDDSFYFAPSSSQHGDNMRFPMVYPFSATVPELGLALLKVAGLMVTFLSQLHVPNAGGLVFSALERGATIVKDLILEQVQDAETDTHILKASQISVNSAYLSKMPVFLAMTLWDALNALQFGELGQGRSSRDKEASFQSLGMSGKALEASSDRARDLIFELVRRKVDDLISGMQFVKWDTPSMRKQPHPYADDLISYLRVTFMNLSALPTSMREAVHFTCMTHICNIMLETFTSPQVTAINILGIYNMGQDIQALVDFSQESNIANLEECFSKLKHITDIILRNDAEVMVDEARRSAKYPGLDVGNLILVLEKYKNLSLAAKIRNTVGDEVPQLEQKQVAQIIKQIKKNEARRDH